MILGIIVEGPDDLETYPVLIRRIRPSVGHIHRRQCFGLRNLKNKFVGFLKELPVGRGIPVEKALVIRDSDCDAPETLERQLEGILRESGFRPEFTVHFYATKCKLESWLLADEQAISRVSLARRGPGNVQPVAYPLENYNDAEKLLLRVLREAGLSATPRVYAEIASCANTARIAERCPYFREFARRVEDC